MEVFGRHSDQDIDFVISNLGIYAVIRSSHLNDPRPSGRTLREEAAIMRGGWRLGLDFIPAVKESSRRNETPSNRSSIQRKLFILRKRANAEKRVAKIRVFT